MRAPIRLSLALLLGAAGCSKTSAHDESHESTEPTEEEARAKLPKVPHLETPEREKEYEPTPSELPLTADFAKAAAKRVTPDNYRKELIRIERELEQLASH